MYDDCEIPDFYSHSDPVARKAHKCCECGVAIDKGEKHFFVTGKWGGGIQRYRQHILCMNACVYARDYLNGYECIAFGQLFEWCGEVDYLRDTKKSAQSKEFRGMMANILRRQYGRQIRVTV